MTDRAVFDCMIYLQAAARPNGPAAACLRLVLQRRVELCVSAPILEEVKDVLSRDKLRRKFPALTDDAVGALIRDVKGVAFFVDVVPHVFDLPRDPKDEKYLDIAIACGAVYVVSRDNDILDLTNDEAFRQKYPHLTILDPVEFLKRIKP